MEHGAANRNVVELHAFARLPQQQAAAAHVAAPDEVDREPEAVAEDREQDVDILGRRDAAEQHHVAVRPDLVQQRARAPFERPPIAGIVLMHVAVGKCLYRFVRDVRIGTAQAGVRCDDVDAASQDRGVRRVRIGRPREAQRVGELAAEVETADEHEDVAEHRAAPRAELFGSANVAFGDSTCFARVPLQFAGDSKNTLACITTADTD